MFQIPVYPTSLLIKIVVLLRCHHKKSVLASVAGTLTFLIYKHITTFQSYPDFQTISSEIADSFLK
ncbi:hypothetical protein PT2222_180129 [Paraburkholderia tropica]